MNELTHEQCKHLNENSQAFVMAHHDKYVGGQKNHGGNMWEMGAYQALENAEEECLDNWNYLRQIRNTLDEIREACDRNVAQECSDEVLEILNREKRD